MAEWFRQGRQALTDDQDTLVWLTDKAKAAFESQVAKANFKPLHGEYVEQEWNRVMAHVICKLHGMSPTEEDIVRCVRSAWPLSKINQELRSKKKASAPNPSSTREPVVVRMPYFAARTNGRIGATRYA